jgi:hypothetical protein
MEPWLPEHEDDFEEQGEDDRPSVPVAFVSTQQTVPLRVDQVPDDRTPDGMVCMGTFFNRRLIARSIIPPEALDELANHEVFDDPVRLGLAAVEQDPGLQCRLYALLPASKLTENDDEPNEPWAESVPRFEDAQQEEQDADEEGLVPILLGHIVRFERDRRHPENLAAEAADVLQTLLSEERPVSEIVDKILDDL